MCLKTHFCFSCCIDLRHLHQTSVAKQSLVQTLANLASVCEEIVQWSKLTSAHTKFIKLHWFMLLAQNQLHQSQAHLGSGVVDKLEYDLSKINGLCIVFEAEHILFCICLLRLEFTYKALLSTSWIAAGTDNSWKEVTLTETSIKRESCCFINLNICCISMLDLFAWSGAIIGLGYHHESEVFSIQSAVPTACQRFQIGEYIWDISILNLFIMCRI